MLLKFDKYQALGNDFIILDESHHIRQAGASHPSLNAEQCRLLCDRHIGIGADGILTLFRSQESKADLYMHVMNADGSTANICGNGARCVAEWLHNRHGESALQGALETDSGLRKFTRVNNLLTFDMGMVRIGERLIFQAEEISYTGTMVDVGNTHLIFAGHYDRISAERLVAKITPNFDRLSCPNIAFVNVIGAGELQLLVYERGVGFTHACGSGACAAAAFCYQKGLIATPKIAVIQSGGSLEVVLSQGINGLRVSLTGVAQRVFSGEILI